VLQQIAKLWLEGRSLRAIGAIVGMAHTTVAGHLQRTIRPAWQEELVSSRATTLAKIAHIESTAWDRYEGELGSESPDGQSMTAAMKTIQWCVEQVARIDGHYASLRVKREEAGVRIAGLPQHELHNEFRRRLEARMQEMEEHRQAVLAWEGRTSEADDPSASG